ncbi:PilW family protein [Paenibacillus silvisoli]|uniref:PilW family protein n=1 Tax=Paenibacillus silvisoli TaxID=3110539 RepID=UPI002805438B|nr:prepilin-type N-terminal cleavage/methylation domain-containing protein [Paenibacillus silvisoli]
MFRIRTRIYLNQRGLTLIELLAAVMILVLILSLAYPLLTFGVKTYGQSQTRSSLQDQVQLASLAVTKLLRYASEASIETAATCPTTLQTGYNYICVDSTDNSIKHIVYNVSTNSFTSGPIVKDMSGKRSFTILFSKNATNAKLLNFDLTGQTSTQSYHIQTELLIMNASADIQGTSGFKVMKYK